MTSDDAPNWFDQPPAPLEQLHQQVLKNRDYALAALELLPEDQAKLLRKDLTKLLKGSTAAYEADDATTHYRLSQKLFFEFMMNLNFTLQANHS